RIPAAVDRPDQRGRAPPRPLVQPLHVRSPRRGRRNQPQTACRPGRARSGGVRGAGRGREEEQVVSGPSFQQELEGIASAAAEIATADANRLAELKVELLGRKAGRLTKLLRAVPGLPTEERRALGA